MCSAQPKVRSGRFLSTTYTYDLEQHSTTPNELRTHSTRHPTMPADTCLPQEAWDDQLMLSVGQFAIWRGCFVNPSGAVLRQGCKQCISAVRTDEQHPGLLLTSQLCCISQEGSVADVYATRHVGSSAWRCIKEQFSSGWQPGAAVSGHARTRLMQQLNSGVLLLTLRDAAVVLCLIYIQN